MAVVTMFSSVYAIKALIQTNMEGMGWNYSVIIAPEFISPKPLHRFSTYPRSQKSTRNLDLEDLIALRDGVHAKTVYGMIENSETYIGKGKSISVRLRATNTDFFTGKNYSILYGRKFNNYEIENRIPVIILGYYFAKEQFGYSDPTGKMIRVGSHQYRIVGVLDDDQLNKRNGMDFNNQDRKEDLKAVYIPLQYGVSYLTSNGALHYIYLQANDEDGFEQLKEQARQILLARHNMYPNFRFVDIGAFLLTINREIDNTMKKWNITLSAIASISLIVGGIGLFSTLLISIQEKMTEIGIRKSIGATERDIFNYFIVEAVFLALLGAAIGVGIAWLALLGMEKAINVPLFLPIQGVILGTVFAAIVGFVSGLYPALKASGIDPIQAIYYHE